MKRLSLILVAALAFSPIMAVGDILNPQNSTQRIKPTFKEKACKAAALVALSAGATYLAYKYDWLGSKPCQAYRNAYATALATSKELVSNGNLRPIPDFMTPEDFHKNVIEIAISSGNTLTEYLRNLPGKTFATLQRGFPGPHYAPRFCALIWFVYFPTLISLSDLYDDGLKACHHYFSPEQTENIE